MKRLIIPFVIIVAFALPAAAQQATYCNPVNIPYGYTPIPAFAAWGKHRATADPEIVNYKGDYYLFCTNQWGYYVSSDMLNWEYKARLFLRPWNTGTYDELCAPAVGIIGDTMLVFGSTYTSKFTIWMSTNPKANEWKPLVDSFEIGGWDPAFFTDDATGKLYLYNGSSNVYPIFGVELNRKTMQPIGSREPLYVLQDWRYGWQRFGEHMDNTFLNPFIEGAHMTKHNGKYYLQYGAPGTEFSGYADGVLVSNSPLGGFVPQSDPYSFKPGGFSRGAGHGGTFQDNSNNWWHVSTSIVCVKNTFERRIGIWPAGFDKDDVIYANTAFGDYPQKLPGKEDVHNGMQSNFAGWMLLNYNKPVEVSSTLGSHTANNAVDESSKTYWSAVSANSGEYFISDLGEMCTVNAVQINYADQDAEFLGKSTGVSHKYKLYSSADGKKWSMIKDKSKNETDVPHDYVELEKPVQARYIKLENIHMSTGKFALMGLRVFGKGGGLKPSMVEDFIVLRTESDKRSAYIKWRPKTNAYAYNIYYGTAPDKMYNCVMVHSDNEYWFKAMDLMKKYYFTIEAINENGVSPRTPVKEVN